ncbi:MAG: hypothetical protein ACHQ3P_04310 [Candidatus Limnocylindrales bacterium]
MTVMRKVLGIGAIGLGAAGLGAAAAFEMRIHPAWRSWGIDADEAARHLPGDDLVEIPDVIDTRGITIDAPPDTVWPWLVQMGHRRGGWYSYDELDMRGPTVRTVVPEWQSIAVGDVIPTDAEGGFRVKVVEPGRALVLYLTSADFAGRSSRRRGRHHEPTADDSRERVTDAEKLAGGATGAMRETFAATWAFILEPIEGGRTRLIERYRIRMTEPATPSFKRPALDLGVFIMVRRQMLGIRERAEELHRPALATEVPGSATPIDAQPARRPAKTATARATPEPKSRVIGEPLAAVETDPNVGASPA